MLLPMYSSTLPFVTSILKPTFINAMPEIEDQEKQRWSSG